MDELITLTDRKELEKLSDEIECLYKQGDYELCEKMIRQAIGKYPHAPHPHNLFGILLENSGNKVAAMNHYRASIALEPSYKPARCNLYRYGDMSNRNTIPTFSDKEC
ncbi:hypothetical protein ACO1PF_08475 [Alkalibacterium sp. f15]|uniref:hypothetical protein n=1 Tax=Alkalibacterium sp. f15 TaxID=3414029 RepID=UPI003BF7B146